MKVIKSFVIDEKFVEVGSEVSIVDDSPQYKCPLVEITAPNGDKLCQRDTGEIFWLKKENWKEYVGPEFEDIVADEEYDNYWSHLHEDDCDFVEIDWKILRECTLGED